ncbi:MAG: cytochrome C oxidase subunit IV family protein [Planctomycetaceae bacterium]
MSHAEHADPGAHAHSPYMKIFLWLTVLTVLEIAWALPWLGLGKLPLVFGLGVMAAVKAALVGLYYMHLRYETRLIWGVILLPLFLVVVMVAGFLPDALGH